MLTNAGVFDVTRARKAGISKTSLLRLIKAGQIERVGRGLYLHTKTPIKPEVRDFAVACAKFGPKSVIGGMTALFHYGLIEQVPRTIWILVPYQKKSNERLYRCLRTKLPGHIGVEDRGSYRITGLERTLVEAFRYASKIGLRTAVHAARTALTQRLTSEKKIYQMARELKLENVIVKHWETVVP